MADVFNDETWLSPHVSFKTLTYAILIIMKHKPGSAETPRGDGHARAVLMLHKPHLWFRPREDVVDEDANDALGNPDEENWSWSDACERSFAAGPTKTNTTHWSYPAMDIPDSNDSGKSNNTEVEPEECPLTCGEVVDIRPADQLRQEEVETTDNRDLTSNVTGDLRSSTCFVKAILEI
ncbi:hypothetical protein E4U61_005748 [Claviceps capensis]|nr:hypothetical protein E4U61_005748 [Claviceps capensis]